MFKIHFTPFWVILGTLLGGMKMGGLILSHVSTIFGLRKFLQVFDIVRGENNFFPKVPQICQLVQNSIFLTRDIMENVEKSREEKFIKVFLVLTSIIYLLIYLFNLLKSLPV